MWIAPSFGQPYALHPFAVLSSSQGVASATEPCRKQQACPSVCCFQHKRVVMTIGMLKADPILFINLPARMLAVRGKRFHLDSN